MKNKKKFSADKIKKNLAKATALMAKQIDAELKSSMSEASGLCYYEDDAFNYDDGFEFEKDRKSTRLNSSHVKRSRMPSSA